MFYIVEHFEEEFSRWAFCEYVHMILILTNLYADSNTHNKLIITNFKYKAQKETIEEDEFSTKKHTE